MSPHLNQVERSHEVFGTVQRSLLHDKTEPICFIDQAHLPGETASADDAKQFYLIFEADDYYGNRQLGVLEVEDISADHQQAHVELQAEGILADDPAITRTVVRAIMERVGIRKATLNPECDSNLSESALKRAGFIAVSNSAALEFQIAA